MGLATLWERARVVNNDSGLFLWFERMNYITKTVKLGENIAQEKNKLLKEMLASDCNYFFLVEDNCEVLDAKVYDTFIDVSEKTGIEALMWAKGSENIRLPFNDDEFIDYWSDFPPAFNMFTRNAVEKVGFFDEKMPVNTLQDLEYAKRIGDAGLSTPFGQFASPKGVDSYLKITKSRLPFENTSKFDEALSYWEEKDGEDFPVEMTKKPKVFEMI